MDAFTETKEKSVLDAPQEEARSAVVVAAPVEEVNTVFSFSLLWFRASVGFFLRFGFTVWVV